MKVALPLEKNIHNRSKPWHTGPYDLWDKNTIGWRRSNIATQERKVCDVEVEIVKFVVKGSAQLTIPLDPQE